MSESLRYEASDDALQLCEKNSRYSGFLLGKVDTPTNIMVIMVRNNLILS